MELKVEFITRDFIHQQLGKTAFVCICVCTYLYLCACEVMREGNTRKLSLKPSSYSFHSLMCEAVGLAMMKALDEPRELCLIRRVVFLMCMLGDFSWEDSGNKN